MFDNLMASIYQLFMTEIDIYSNVNHLIKKKSVSQSSTGDTAHIQMQNYPDRL